MILDITFVNNKFIQFDMLGAGSEGLNYFLNLAIALALIIAAAKLGGYLSLRLHQPAVLGELIVGILLGPTLLDFLQWQIFSYSSDIAYDILVSEINSLAEIGVLLLMFIAGLDLHISDLAKSGKVAVFAGVLGVAFPLVLGIGTGIFFEFGPEEAIFIGLVLAATSVSISAQTLMEMGKLRTRVGIGLLGAAVFDDILVVLGISIFFALFAGAAGGITSILLIFLRMLLYLALAMSFGYFVLPKLSSRIERLPVSRGLLAFVFVTMLVYAWLAEVIGQMAPITGAFIAGLLFARSPLRDRIEQEISGIAYGIFVPIFFVSVGLAANLREFTIATFGLFVIMTTGAIIGKLLGAGLGAKAAGFTNKESLQLGVGMMSRGEVGLIVANQGISQGIITGGVFTAVVGVVLVTTLLTPLLLRRLFNEKGEVKTVAQEA